MRADDVYINEETVIVEVGGGGVWEGVEDGHGHRKVIIQESEVIPVITGDIDTDVLEGANKGDKDMMVRA